MYALQRKSFISNPRIQQNKICVKILNVMFLMCALIALLYRASMFFDTLFVHDITINIGSQNIVFLLHFHIHYVV